MKNYHKLTIATLLILTTLLLTAPGTLLAQDISLAWDPSDSEDVVGYKVYYKADSTELPLDGIEALEGPSPIDVGNVTSFTLTELPEGSVYYFRATAYDSEGNESDLSNLAASEWIPAPLVPGLGEITGSMPTLVWSDPPEGLDLTFTIIIGTDPKLRSSSAIVTNGTSRNNRPHAPLTAPNVAAILCLTGIGLRQLIVRVGKRRLLAATVCLGLALSTASCGGGGGGGDDVSSSSASLSSADDTILVAGLTDSYYTPDELEEGITYYWKIVAEDSEGIKYESEISSFVVE